MQTNSRKSARKSTRKPARKSARKPARKSARKPVRKLVRKPVRKSRRKSRRKPRRRIKGGGKNSILNPVNRGRKQRDRYISNAKAKEATLKDVANIMLGLSRTRVHKKSLIGSRVFKKFPGTGKQVWEGTVTAGPDSKGRFRVYWPGDDSYTWHSRSVVEKILIPPRSSNIMRGGAKKNRAARRRSKSRPSKSVDSKYLSTEMFNYIIYGKYGFLKNFGIGFDAHQIDPEKWVDLTIKSIKLGELFRNMTAFPKLTKDQLYDLFLIYSVDLERSSEKGEKSGGVLNQVIIDAFDDEEKGMEFLNHAIDQMEEELYWDEFVSKATELRQNGKLYDTFHSRFIKDEARDIILPVGKHLYSGIHSSSKPTIKSIRSYKDYFWCSDGFGTAVKFSGQLVDKSPSIVEYEVKKGISALEMSPFTYLRTLAYIHFMNTGEYKEFSISTAEGRKELKEIFCGLGYGAWFISDFYIKKDYFLPNSKLLLKKITHASDILICDVEKVTIKNIYSGELGLGKLQNEVFLIYTGNDQNKQAKTVVLDRFVNGKTTTEIRQKRLVDTIGSDRQYTFGTK